MEPIDTLITARWIVPIEPDGRVLEDHAVAIHRGLIVAVVPDTRGAGAIFGRELIERPAHVLLPGFVNTHTQAAMTLLRGAAESASFDHWLNRQIRAAGAALDGCGVRARRHRAGDRRHAHQRYDLLCSTCTCSPK